MGLYSAGLDSLDSDLRRPSAIIAVLFALMLVLSVVCGSNAVARDGLSRKCYRVLHSLLLDRDPDFKFLNGESVEVIRKIPGSYGGNRYVIRPKKGKDWLSLVGGKSPQGSPLWIFEYLDAETAKFFGFYRDGENVVVPDQDEFRGAIRTFNTIPKTKVSPVATWSIYTESRLLAPSEEYVLCLATEGALPWGARGNYFHHDLYFHVLCTVLMPTEFLHLVRNQLLAVFAFKGFLKRQYPAIYDDPFTKDLFAQYFKELSTQMDFGTGLLSQPVALKLLAEPGVPHPDVIGRLQSFISHGRSPKDFLDAFSKRFSLKADAQKNLVLIESQRKYQAALREFIELKSARDSRFTRGIDHVDDRVWLKNKVLARVGAIQQEVHQYNRANRRE